MPTTPTARNYDVSHIHQGPGDLWIIGTPPVDSAAPVLTLATDGSPDSTAHPLSVHLGATDSAITTIITPKIEDIKADQFEGPVARYQTDLEASIEAELLQIDPKLMQQSLPFTVFSTQASPGFNLLTFGSLAIASPVAVACIAAKRGAVGKFIVSLLFMAHGSIGLNTAIGRAKKASYKAQFKAMSDMTRTLGRTMGVFYETL